MLSEGLYLRTVLIANHNYRLSYKDIDGDYAIVLYHKNEDTDKWETGKVIGMIKPEGLSEISTVSEALPAECAHNIISKINKDDDEYEGH